MSVRCRFAPSPTGYMHVGGLRTALYSYLFAKKAGGEFILRIEDTDRERFVEGALEIIIDTLNQAGLHFDEGPGIGGSAGPYIQSERQELYKEHADILLENGNAYYCFCDKKTLDEQRAVSEASRVPHKYDRRCLRLTAEETAAKLEEGLPRVVRQKTPTEGVTHFDDIVYGRIEVQNSELDDQVLLKGDGMPTYNFANVIDDHLMNITHIIRGNEFLASTPKHRLLYDAFGWKTPEYIHCPPIMRDKTHKLSKRDGDAYYGDFLERGYLKEAILNYIALLGWSEKASEREIFSLEELAEAFDVSGISKSPAIFDVQKLKWMNGQYLKQKSLDEFHAAALPYIEQTIKRDIDTKYLAGLLQARCDLLCEIPEQIDFVETLPEFPLDLFINKKMKTDIENSEEAIAELAKALSEITDWTRDEIHAAVMALVEKLGVKNGRVLFPLRVALSGKEFTPGGGVELCVLLGRDETLSRLNRAIERM